MLEFDPMQTMRDLADTQRREVAPPANLRAELEVVARDRDRSARAARPRRRRRASLVLLVGLVLGGGVATAAWLWGQPTAPEGGPVCRLGPTSGSDQYVLSPGADALTACAQLWESGELPDPDAPLPPGQPVPPLTACIGVGGVVEVFPAEPGICIENGLQPMNPEATPLADAVAELSARVVAEINNSGTCDTKDEVVAKADRLIDELGLSDWSVSLQPSLGVPACAKARVESGTKEIFVFEFATSP